MCLCIVQESSVGVCFHNWFVCLFKSSLCVFGILTDTRKSLVLDFSQDTEKGTPTNAAVHNNTITHLLLLLSGRSGCASMCILGLIHKRPQEVMVDDRWLGMEIFHHTFVKEHNRLCKVLRTEYPLETEDNLFEFSRHIVAALIAKVHTVWRPT